MDLDVFDDVARQAADGSSRRSLVRAGLGALGLTGLGLAALASDADAGGKGKGKNKGKKKKRCKGERPNKCGQGCCPANYPNCCEWAGEPNPAFAFSCAPSNNVCCPVSQGGGSCEAGEKCCPPTLTNQFGSCAEAADVCCPANSKGSSCPASAPVCCDFDCCPTGSVCAVNGACSGDFNLEGECCVPDNSRTGSVSKSRGTPRFVLPVR